MTDIREAMRRKPVKGAGELDTLSLQGELYNVDAALVTLQQFIREDVLKELRDYHELLVYQSDGSYEDEQDVKRVRAIIQQIEEATK